MYFKNRSVAGKLLAKRLSNLRDRADTLLLALSHGGMPVAHEIAETLHLPLDLMVLDRPCLSTDSQPALRATTDPKAQAPIGVDKEPPPIIPPQPKVKGKTVILVDDGCATGIRMLTAIQTAAKADAEQIIVAVPVASQSAFAMLNQTVDEVICLYLPQPFLCIGKFYWNFPFTEETEVNSLPEVMANENAFQRSQ